MTQERCCPEQSWSHAWWWSGQSQQGLPSWTNQQACPWLQWAVSCCWMVSRRTCAVCLVTPWRGRAAGGLERMSSGGHWSLSVWLLSIQCHGPPRCVSSVSSSAKDLDKLVNFSHEYGILTVDLLYIIAGGGPWARDTKSFLTHMVQHRVKTQI